MAYPIDPAYLTARKALLDVLDVLGPHLKSIVLVGAQAIYIHTGEAVEAVVERALVCKVIMQQ